MGALKKRTGASAMILGVAFVQLAKAQDPVPVFDFGPQGFKSRFNRVVETDGGDRVREVVQSARSSYAAKIEDVAFQKSVRGFKELNLANGKFTLQESITLEVAPNGKVSKILVSGYRGDMMNLLHFIGTVGNIVVMLNPQMSKKEIGAFLLDLGLMRGDDDKSIGTPSSNFVKGGAFICLNARSSVTMKVGCVIEPRS